MLLSVGLNVWTFGLAVLLKAHSRGGFFLSTTAILNQITGDRSRIVWTVSLTYNQFHAIWKNAVAPCEWALVMHAFLRVLKY